MPIKELDLDLMTRLKNTDAKAKRRVLSMVLEGSWSALLKGRGMEFAGFRQYTYGDDASRIDWNATLRAKETLVREFEEYKTVNVLMLLDVSDSMLFTTTSHLKAEYAAQVTFDLAASIIEAGDNVGYAVFSDRIIVKELPGLGREILYRLSQALMKGENYGGKSDFKQVMTLVNSLLSERSLIILISDFIGLPEGWERYIRMLGGRYDLIGIMIRDRHDYELPFEGLQVVVTDPTERGERLLVDVKQYAAEYRRYVEKEERYIRNVFEHAKAGFLKLENGEEPLDRLVDFFRKRVKMVRS